jgi:hypothetical protein
VSADIPSVSAVGDHRANGASPFFRCRETRPPRFVFRINAVIAFTKSKSGTSCHFRFSISKYDVKNPTRISAFLAPKSAFPSATESAVNPPDSFRSALQRRPTSLAGPCPYPASFDHHFTKLTKI